MQFETLKTQTDVDGTLTLWLDRAQKRNAISGQMISELAAFVHAMTTADDVRVVVLRGSGETFCAGGDLAWMKAQIDADRQTRMDEARELADMLRALNEMGKPLIAVIHGAAFGGGVGLACVCDYVIAADDVKFGLTETRLGLIPATIGPYVIARMGEGPARQVFMSSAVFDAHRARDLGLVSEVVSPDQIEAALLVQLAHYQKCGPHAVAQAKALARRLGPPIDDAVITATIEALADVWEGAEACAGIDAFFAKQPPPWAKSR